MFGKLHMCGHHFSEAKCHRDLSERGGLKRRVLLFSATFPPAGTLDLCFRDTLQIPCGGKVIGKGAFQGKSGNWLQKG